MPCFTCCATRSAHLLFRINAASYAPSSTHPRIAGGPGHPTAHCDCQLAHGQGFHPGLRPVQRELNKLLAERGRWPDQPESCTRVLLPHNLQQQLPCDSRTASALPALPVLQIICLAASVILAYFVCSDGTTNWLMGLQLIATYCLIAFIYALKKEPLPPGPVPSPSPVPVPPPSPHHW